MNLHQGTHESSKHDSCDSPSMYSITASVKSLSPPSPSLDGYSRKPSLPSVTFTASENNYAQQNNSSGNTQKSTSASAHSMPSPKANQSQLKPNTRSQNNHDRHSRSTRRNTPHYLHSPEHLYQPYSFRRNEDRPPDSKQNKDTEDEMYEEEEEDETQDYTTSQGYFNPFLDTQKILTPLPKKKTSKASHVSKKTKISFQKHKIAVIGAGISGISAAKHLKDAGFSVVVFDGRNRIGGRIHSLECHALKGLDVGASWIHGITHNPIYETCVKHNLQIYPDNYNNEKEATLYDANGEKYNEYFDGWALNTHQSHLKEAEEYAQSVPINESINLSLGEILEEKLEESSQNDPMRRRILNWHLANIEYSTGANVNDLSLNTWDQDDETALDGPHVMIADGYQKIVEIYAADLDIRLEHVIQKIQYNEEGVTLHFTHTSTPSHFEFCIVTVPLGVLKASLDQSFLNNNNIDHTYFAHQTSLNTKLTWHESLQPTPSYETIPVPPHTIPNFAVKNTATNSTSNTSNLKSNQFNPTACIRFEPPLPEYKQSVIKRMGFGLINKILLVFPRIFWDCSKTQIGWASGIRGQYSQIILLHPKPALLILLLGKFSIESEQREPQELIAEAMAVLSSIHGPIPPPLYTSISCWLTDPFSRGSYSYLPPGMLGRDYDILSYPVKHRLLFAGEHTMRPYPSTVHGAYLSGRREAERIIDWGTGRLKREQAYKWFEGPEKVYTPAILNQYDGYPEYQEDTLEGPSEEGREGWFSQIKCAFCSQLQTLETPFIGCVRLLDSSGASRLFAVHETCAYYTPEVVSNNEGSRWFNVSRALIKSASVPCMICQQPGASITCSFKGCTNTFHGPCAFEILHWPCYKNQNRTEALFCSYHSARPLSTPLPSLPNPRCQNLRIAVYEIFKFVKYYKETMAILNKDDSNTYNNKKRKLSVDDDYAHTEHLNSAFQDSSPWSLSPAHSDQNTLIFDKNIMFCSLRKLIHFHFSILSSKGLK